MSSSTTSSVRHRHVFYVPGYDPFHPRRYRELYRSESAEQGQISGYDIAISRAKSGGLYGWNVDAKIEGQDTKTTVEVLYWSDLVRDSMKGGVIETYQRLIKTAWIYINTGALFRLAKLRKGPVIAALYPVGFLLLQLVIALCAAWGLGKILSFLNPLLHWAGLIVVPFILGWFRKNDNRFYAYYLMQDYAYSAGERGAYPPELEGRMDEFVNEIARALASDVDEVLVVGHSSGAYLAVTILADLLRQNDSEKWKAELSFLSLGHVVPMVSFLPMADKLRGDLQYLCEREELVWVDVTAPSDGGTFALCDPVAVTGVATENKRWPLVLSAAYTQTLSPEKWQSMRWRFFKLHIQYLCAFDRPGDYDYFQITAGPQTLSRRYRDRASSPSRIERATSGYRGVGS
ncbi:hypothetical protein ROA7450_00522 [Roseovarius albus]|uniref:Alpha/beta hydrolase family protein n=1 Tax=Roseovarius albus TaxID=1247867 RepID=A0A1X6YCB5_9RHOB|nr:hypothetical protein [Roseovarius albus]SLN17156.1 hypothetical protein ROA7450_00522 [Roseovarius albus]